MSPSCWGVSFTGVPLLSGCTYRATDYFTSWTPSPFCVLCCCFFHVASSVHTSKGLQGKTTRQETFTGSSVAKWLETAQENFPAHQPSKTSRLWGGMLEPVMAFGLDLLQPFKAWCLRMDLSVTAVCVVCQSQPYFHSQTSHSHLSSSHQGKCILLAHREMTARSFRRCNSKKPRANDFQQPWLTVLSGARKKKNPAVIFASFSQGIHRVFKMADVAIRVLWLAD